MNLLLTAVPLLTEKSPDPEDVKAGWLAFGVFLLLIVAVVLLAFSLVKHLKRAQANLGGDDTATREDDATPDTGPNGEAPQPGH
ncbi:MAG: hypothetical protein ACRDPJ_22935 [Nocardioidaceae bacterium]